MLEPTLKAFADELEKIAANGALERVLQARKVIRKSPQIDRMKSSVREMKKMVSNLGSRTGTATKKLATMTKYTEPVKTASGTPARRANEMFGLPLHHGRRKNTRMYEAGPSAAQSADRSQSPIAGQITPDVGAANAISPAYGPGGV
jgi:hypothetical protein